MSRYFVFVDESGNTAQEQFLGIGCLLVPVERIGEYHERLKSKYGQIHSAVQAKEQSLLEALPEADLRNYARGRHSPYEMKFKNINPTTVEQYKWLLTEYFKFSDCHFCCLIINKHAYPIPTGMEYFDAYLNQLFMLLKNNVGEDEFILLPDDISVPAGKTYEATLMSKCAAASKKCLGIHRLSSHSSLFLQMVDVLTGAVTYECKGGVKIPKLEICAKIRSKIDVASLHNKITRRSPNYFSVWIYEKRT